jgi:deazaflavin-dependent oxidoreductase (nitroreductase family)
MHAHDTYLRWLYRGGRPSRFGRVLNRLSAVMFSAGIMPSRAATLEITGRKSGRPVSFPVVIADYRGERYLVSMLGASTNWVRNLKAAGGQAVLRHGRQELIGLQEIPVADRAPVLRRYLQVAPGGRPHIPVDRRAPLADFERVAADYPVYRIQPRVAASATTATRRQPASPPARLG